MSFNEVIYYVYILTSKRDTVIYVGVTNNLARRLIEHIYKIFSGFTGRYNVNKLVYCEKFGDINEAICREKQIKGRTRIKKLSLIKAKNPEFIDLSHKFINQKIIEEYFNEYGGF